MILRNKNKWNVKKKNNIESDHITQVTIQPEQKTNPS